MATQIVELTGDEVKLLKSLDKVIQKQVEYENRLKETGREGQKAGAEVASGFEASGKASEKAMKEYLRELRKIGPEGRKGAEALEQHLRATGQAGYKSMDTVLEQIREIDPEAADAAAAAQRAFSSATNTTEREYRNLLSQMRSMGPEGKKAADQIEREMVAAGKISERSLGSMVDKLAEIDPEAAEAARAIVDEMSDAGKKSTKVFADFGKNAVLEIGKIATAYIGVQEAIQLVNDYLELQFRLIERARDEQISLAAAQQQSAKNLAGLSSEVRGDLLRREAPGIASRTGFEDLAEIVQAIGAVASAGESDPKRIADAVEQAARIERLSPENLDTTAANAAAVTRQAGLGDVRQGLALVETAGTQARITDPGALLQSLPLAVGSSVATVPGQDAELAARQSAALFAQITQGANDEVGRSSATFQIDFTNRLRSFFTEMADEQVKARSKIELIDRRIDKGSDTELDQLNRSRLADFLAASEGVTDPGSLFGRLALLQSSPALSQQFRGEGFGEKRFQTTLDALLESGSDLSESLNKSFDVIKADVGFFESEAEAVRAGTPQLAIASAASKTNAARVAFDVGNLEGAALAQVRQTVADTLVETSGPLGGLAGNVVKYGGLGGSAIEEAILGGSQLLETRRRLAKGGITDSEALRISRIDSSVESLRQLVQDLATSGDIDPTEAFLSARERLGGIRLGQVQATTDAQQFQVDMLELLKTIALNTNQPQAVPQPVTPALSAQQP